MAPSYRVNRSLIEGTGYEARQASVIIGFLAWESTSVKTWGNSLAVGISTGSVIGCYLQRHQQHSELKSNDIILIQERNQSVTRM